MANKMYDVAVDPQRFGEVTGHTTKTFTFDVHVTPADVDADEFIIAVNGRIVKRMNRWQAERLGLVERDVR